MLYWPSVNQTLYGLTERFLAQDAGASVEEQGSELSGVRPRAVLRVSGVRRRA